jgi:penicillin-binding protein 1A
VHELSVRRSAYLAALPKAPNNYHPFRQRERAFERRNYVLDRMAEDRYITAQEVGEVEERAAQDHAAADRRAHLRAEYFAEEVAATSTTITPRRSSTRAGLSVRTTLDPKMQVLARKCWSTAS